MQAFSHKDKTELDLGRQEIRIKYSSIKWLNKNNDAVIKSDVFDKLQVETFQN